MFEAIVLAGGLGTRLKKIVKDLPKPMAPMGDKPFLYYLFLYLKRNNVKRIVLAVSYKKEAIIKYFSNQFEDIPIIYSIETEPLGTGGAIKKAIALTRSDDVFVLNGDTYFDINLEDLYRFHKERRSELSIALRVVEEGNRYGAVEVDESGLVVGFYEKVNRRNSLINGGVYLINKHAFSNLSKNLPETFSFEMEVLEPLKLKTYGKVYYNYFIDIGVPEEYERARKELTELFNR